MWGTTNPSVLKETILSELRRLGATRMEAPYSGGNDEGGCDNVHVLRPVGKSDWMVYDVVQYGQGHEPRRGMLRAGPFSTKKEAQTAARALEKSTYVVSFEFEKAEGEFVELVGADVGDWDREGGLLQAVNDLLSIDFGSWAGDFSAYGTVYADLHEGRVWREGEMSTYQADPEAGDY